MVASKVDFKHHSESLKPNYFCSLDNKSNFLPAQKKIVALVDYDTFEPKILNYYTSSNIMKIEELNILSLE